MIDPMSFSLIHNFLTILVYISSSYCITINSKSCDEKTRGLLINLVKLPVGLLSKKAQEHLSCSEISRESLCVF